MGYTTDFLAQTIVSRVDSDIWWRMPITMHEVNKEQVFTYFVKLRGTLIHVFVIS